MIFNIFVLTSVLLVCEGTFQDQVYYRRAPLRFLFNNQRRPEPIWNYEVINGRPVISGFANPSSYVAFGLNPQTGQIEQTQIITQTRPGGPFINMIQNMMNVAGQFVGQLTGAFGNAVEGAIQTAGKFGQDIQDMRNPFLSVTAISRPPIKPVQQPIEEVKPPTLPSVQTSTVPSMPTPSTPAVEILPEQPKSETELAGRTIDQALISLQTFRTNLLLNFETLFESDDGKKTWNEINENLNSVGNQLQELRETAVSEPRKALQSGQNAINTGFDTIETGLVGIAGAAGREFIEPTRNELNKSFNDAIQVYKQSQRSVNPATGISPA